MDHSIRILHLEDDPADAELVLSAFVSAGIVCQVTLVQTRGEFEVALRQDRFDIILADYKLPMFDGISALRMTRELHVDAPFIFVSGTMGEDTAIECLTKGATDYVLKQNLTRLIPTVKRALNDAEIRRARKQVEEALRESEAEYRRIVETANEGICVLDKDGIITFVNHRLTEMLKYHVKEMKDRPFTDFMFEEDLADHSQKYENRRKGIPENYERRLICKNGQTVWVSVSSVPIFDDEHHFNGSFAMFTDITPHKQMETTLYRMNRELRAISNCNQTLLRSDNEQTLLDEICRIIVDEAGYFMAWVGYAEEDADKTVRPIVWAGAETNYLATANITWDNTERGQGPTGTAIRTGETITIQDFTTDGRIAPWRENAIQRGYRSNIALPLKDENGSTFGALTIYSTEPDAFIPEEKRLLEELAGDLAFGINSIRIRSERKKTEEALMKSEERYRTLIENQGEGTAIVDINENITYINPAGERIFGMLQGEIVNRNLSEFVDSEEMKVITEQTQERSQGQISTYELNIKRQDGEKRVILVTGTPQFDNDGSFIGTFGVFRDITERKKTEDELLKLSSAVEQSPVSIIITDTKGNIEYVNSKFTKVTGYEQSEVLGANPRILKSGDMPSKTYKQLWKSLTSGHEWCGEFHNKKKNGDLFWEFAYLSPIFDTHGDIAHFLAVKEDITERKQAEKELIEAKEKAEESDRLKSAFLSNISHEIRTPLNSIIGFSDLLINSDSEPDKQLGFARIINNSGINLLSIINDILDISKIESGQLRVNKKMFSVSQLINDIKKEYQFKALNKGIELRLDGLNPTNEVFVESDEDRIRQVLTNLVVNAIKFTNDGIIVIGIKMNENFVQFRVKDTGIGIPAKFHEQIFERFRQVESANTRKHGGNGLGLPISKSIVEILGGKIWVESEEGKGSTFYFTIPV
jgi:PAS domain S-box-containing protein